MGTVAIAAPENEHAAPQAYYFLGQYQFGAWRIALEKESLFLRWLPRLSTNIISVDSKSTLQSYLNPPSNMNDVAQLSLPWATGETWSFTGGPHNSPRPWDALDFAGGSGQVRAARDGLASIPCGNYVRIVHANGWESIYYHVANIAVGNQNVTRGQFLGNASAQVGCGGSATGAHVHFGVRYNGVAQDINGHTIGGWTVQEGSSPYAGCLTKNGATQCANTNDPIYNDGSSGSGAIELTNASFESNTTTPWEWVGPCNYAVYSGSTSQSGNYYLATNRNNNNSCYSFYQDALGSPSVGETYRFSIWARSATGSGRQGRVTIWALGGQQISNDAVFSNIGTSWTCVETTLAVQNSNHTGLRAEVYLDSLDSVDYYFDNASLTADNGSVCPNSPPVPTPTPPSSPPPSNNYHYQTNNTAPVCGTTGPSPNIVALRIYRYENLTTCECCY